MEEKEYTIDLMEVADILKENRKPIGKITGIFIIAGFLFWVIARIFFPTYESEAMLQIKQKQSGGGMMAALMGGTGGMGADFLGIGSSAMESYIEILKSRGVVIPVIEATEEADSKGKYPRYENYVKGRISTNNKKLTDILTVKVKADSPEKAQKANQLLIDSFLKRVADLNSDEKGTIKKFLTERLQTAKGDLSKAETALQKFKEENKILSPSANAEIFTQRIMEVEKQAAANKVELEAAEAQLAAINQQLSGSGAASADNKTIQKYNEELAKLETERISYREKYTKKHPRMIEINERIANLKAKIQQEVGKIAALQAPSDNEVHMGLVGSKYSAEGAVSVARQKREALQQLVDQNNAELAKLPAKEQEYVRLNRDYAVANEIFMLLTKQLEQTKITEHQQPTNVLIVDAPTFPERPVFPRGSTCLILAALLGFVGSIGYVVFKELTNRTIRTVENITEYAGLPVFGCIPDVNSLAVAQAVPQEPEHQRFVEKMREYIWKK